METIDTQTSIEPYLDEYRAAADYLEESGIVGFESVANSLRDMRNRVLEVFTDDWTRSTGLNLTEVYVKDGHAYATDGRIMIRVATKQGDTPAFAIERGEWTLGRVLELWNSSWKKANTEGTWTSFPKTPEVEHEDDFWMKHVDVDGRQLSLWLLKRIKVLPNPEYLREYEDASFEFDSESEYVQFMSEQPILFRFRCGEGIAMPMKPLSEPN